MSGQRACAHSYKYQGQIGRPSSLTLDCEHPVCFQCQWCRDMKFSRCGTGRTSRCAPCASLKRGDLRAVARSGASDAASLVALLTLTAPGADHLPWDRESCSHGPGVRCSGKIGCKVDADAAAAWHSTLARRWSWFVTYMRRMVGEDAAFFKTYEWQSRGVLHVHVLVRCSGVSEGLLRAACRSAARRWGFGSQCDLRALPAGLVASEVKPGVSARCPRAAAAGYVAKYVSKGYEELTGVRMIDGNGEIRHVHLRSWSASRSWGDSMATCRARRIGYWAGVAGDVRPAGAPAAPPDPQGPLDPYQGTSTNGSVSEAPTPSCGVVVAM